MDPEYVEFITATWLSKELMTCRNRAMFYRVNFEK